jgi:methionyl-tRNA synthetase
VTTYVTVAIPYVNAAPHLGYAYELVLADVFARARRAAGDDVRFLGGTDDYSLKNVLGAEAAGIPTRAFVDAHAARFEALPEPLEVSFDDFIRTSSDPRHGPAVVRLWQACAARGDLYRREYEGNYCVGCEQFYDVDDLADGCCPEHRVPVDRVIEENWFFRLSAYQDLLERLLTSGELVVEPEPFREEVLAFVRGGLRDISVSRSTQRARGWGVFVPGDPNQTIYVWFDALTNYLSALRFGEVDSAELRTWWSGADARVHVIGKGILRFHAVYWPAFLASAGIALPTRIQVHPYLTIDGEKLSKSNGVTIDPVDVVREFGADALRWWCARDVASVADTDYTTARLVARANEDLAHGLGNVTNRIVTLVHRHRGGIVPSAGARPIDGLDDLEVEVQSLLTRFDLRGASQLIVDAVTELNRYLEATRPWELAKRSAPVAGEGLDRVLECCIESARIIARACGPIVPTLSVRLLEQLGGAPARTHTGALPKPEAVFSRIDAPDPTPS